MLTRNKGIWVVVLAVVMTVMLVAAACGDDDTPTPIPATPIPATPTPVLSGETPPPATSTPTPTPAVTEKIFEGRKMTAAIYAGVFMETIRDTMGKKFEEETGGKIEFVPVVGDFVALIATSPEDKPPFDMTTCFSNDFLHGLAEEIWLPLRLENIPNVADLTDYHTQTAGLGFDGIDLTYGLPFEVGLSVIGYRKDLVPFTPTAFSDLWRPEVAGQTGWDGFFHNNTLGPVALVVEDQPGLAEYYSDEGLDLLFDKLLELPGGVALWWDTPANATAALERGDVSIFINPAEQVSSLVRRDPDKYGMVIPEEGTPVFLDYLCTVRGTQNRDMAEVFINYMLDPELQGAFAEEVPYWMSNSKTVYGPNASVLIPPTNEEREAMVIMPDWVYIVNNWEHIDERLRKEVMSQ